MMIELDALDALALTLHHSPGVQALLLGSGVSRAAGIPTGWEITLDLASRVAAVQGSPHVVDPAAWYLDRFGRAPRYSELLDAVASSPAERRSVIHAYIEGEEAREPTKAHRAIARLVGSGAIRVILTTNFDRLLEVALRDEGVEPAVIASDDAIVGTTPLPHSRCTVVKLHGDYMDARIRNTEGELDSYSPAFDRLLDRILDEYGLVVSGWSGEWDVALRAAILRAPNRRYPFYWTAQSAPGAVASDLITHRNGRLIVAPDADLLFERLSGKLDALRAIDRPHPLSVQMIVAQGRSFCRDDRSAPEWSDLLAQELVTTAGRVAALFPGEAPSKESVNEVVAGVMARTEALRRLVLVGTRWGTDEAFRSALRVITDLAAPPEKPSSFAYWSSLRLLPASLCFHWAVSGALLRTDLVRLAAIMELPISRRYDGPQPAVSMLPLSGLDGVDWRLLTGFERHHTPHSHFFSMAFVADARNVTISPAQADETWDEAEFWIAMEFGARKLPEYLANRSWFWAPAGRFVWARAGRSLAERLVAARRIPDGAPEYAAGLLGGDAKTGADVITAVDEAMRRAASAWH